MIRMDIPPPAELATSQRATGGERTGQADFGSWILRDGIVGSGAMAVSQPQTDSAGARFRLALEVSVLDDRGDSQCLLLPWQLVAGPGLSWRFEGEAGELPMVAAVDGVPAVAAGDATGVDDRANGHAIASGAPMVGTTAVHLGLSQAPRMPFVSNEGRSAESEASARQAPVTGMVSFAARVIRSFERDGEGLAIRIRDFGLDETAERLVVRMIRQALTESGLRLDRLVINSREVWRA